MCAINICSHLNTEIRLYLNRSYADERVQDVFEHLWIFVGQDVDDVDSVRLENGVTFLYSSCEDGNFE